MNNLINEPALIGRIKCEHPDISIGFFERKSNEALLENILKRRPLTFSITRGGILSDSDKLF